MLEIFSFFEHVCILRTKIFSQSKLLKSPEYENDSLKNQPILLSIHVSQNVQYINKYQFLYSPMVDCNLQSIVAIVRVSQ